MTTAVIGPTPEEWRHIVSGGERTVTSIVVTHSIAQLIREGYHLCQVVRIGNVTQIRVVE